MATAVKEFRELLGAHQLVSKHEALLEQVRDLLRAAHEKTVAAEEILREAGYIDYGEQDALHRHVKLAFELMVFDERTEAALRVLANEMKHVETVPLRYAADAASDVLSELDRRGAELAQQLEGGHDA